MEYINIGFITAGVIGVVGMITTIARGVARAYRGESGADQARNLKDGGSPGCRGEKNRYSRVETCEQCEHICDEPEESPTTDVIDHLPIFADEFNERVDCLPERRKQNEKTLYSQDFDYAYPWNHVEKMDGGLEKQPAKIKPLPYPLPLTEESAVAMSFEIWVKDHDVAIKHLEEDSVLQIRPRIQNLETNAQVADKRRTEIAFQLKTVSEIETHLIRRVEVLEKESAILKDKLKDAVFILYQGKEPVTDG